MTLDHRLNRREFVAQTATAGLAAVLLAHEGDATAASSLQDDHVKPVSPLLLIRATELDLGARPLPSAELAEHSISIEVFDETGAKVDTAEEGRIVAGVPYRVTCQIINLGAAPVTAQALLIVAPRDALDTVVGAGRGFLPFYAFEDRMTLAPGAIVALDIPGVVLGESGSTPSIVVQVESSTDAVSKPLNAMEDRHVGRLNIARVA
jgi:hypothetical protein